MVDEELDKIDFTRDKAKEYKDNGEYEKAEVILKKLWVNSKKDDGYLLYEYGCMLRINRKQDIFIDECRKCVGNKNVFNKYVIRQLCWCIYDVYIKNFEKNEESDIEEFIKEANFIRKNCVQLPKENEHLNPYVLTVFKVIRVYLKSASINYKEILKWIEALNPDILSEEVFNFQDNNGQDREMASKKEFYYQYKTKALEKLQRYEECINVCEEALNNIKHFHYRNHIWIKTRLYFSRCMEADENSVDEEIEQYKKIAYKENQWFMYHKLSLICWRYGKMEEALLYANKALTCKFEYEKMNKLLQDVATLWEHKGNSLNAKMYYEASAYYRNRNGWKISEELEFAIAKYNISVNNKPNISLLQKRAADFVSQIEGVPELVLGRIIKINGDYGFIKIDENKENVYFKVKDISNPNLLETGKIVDFKMITTDKGNRAINIKIRRNKDARNMYK